MDLTRVQIRKEGELIPEGVSLTETEIAHWLRIRISNSYITIRITKEPLAIRSVVQTEGYNGDQE